MTFDQPIGRFYVFNGEDYFYCKEHCPGTGYNMLFLKTDNSDHPNEPFHGSVGIRNISERAIGRTFIELRGDNTTSQNKIKNLKSLLARIIEQDKIK